MEYSLRISFVTRRVCPCVAELLFLFIGKNAFKSARGLRASRWRDERYFITHADHTFFENSTVHTRIAFMLSADVFEYFRGLRGPKSLSFLRPLKHLNFWGSLIYYLLIFNSTNVHSCIVVITTHKDTNIWRQQTPFCRCRAIDIACHISLSNIQCFPAKYTYIRAVSS